MKKLKFLGIALALSLVLGACSSDQDKETLEVDEEGTEEVEDNENAKDEDTSESNTSELTVDEETAASIEKEEGIEKAIIQLETIGDKKFVNAHIKLNKMMKGEETAKKYAEQLQEEYPDRIADIIISMDNDIVYQGTFDPK